MHETAQTLAAPLSVRLRARPASAHLLRRELRSWLEIQGVAEAEIFDIVLASSEAFANAVEHPLRPAASVIDVEAEVTAHVLRLTVRDYGDWRNARQREQGGMGFPIMRTLMQTVDVASGTEGSTITLRRRLRSLR